MITALLFSLLLLGLPAQSTQDTSEVQRLTGRVEDLEKRIQTLEKRQDIRRGYYLDTLTAERTAYATLLTVIGALFVFFSYGVVRWRINKTEDNVKEYVGNKEEKIKKEIEYNKNEITENLLNSIRGVREEVSSVKVDVKRDLKLIYEYILINLEEIEDVPEKDKVLCKVRSLSMGLTPISDLKGNKKYGDHLDLLLELNEALEEEHVSYDKREVIKSSLINMKSKTDDDGETERVKELIDKL